MIYSMTAYCHQSFPFPQGTLVVELRSVNHRFLELSLKLGDELRNLETEIRGTLNRLLRGKVECRATWLPSVCSDSDFHYDSQKLEALCVTLRNIQKQCPESAWPTLDTLLQFPGIQNRSAPSDTSITDSFRQRVLDTIDTAVGQLEITRSTEGEKIKTILLDRVTDCRKMLKPLSDQADNLSTQCLERIQARLKQLALEVDSERLLQEATVQALKFDVQEELDRLTIHLDAVETTLSTHGSVGKRLDFLMQELNREANTLASKAIEVEMSQSALQLKLFIEQMREQIQNLV